MKLPRSTKYKSLQGWRAGLATLLAIVLSSCAANSGNGEGRLRAQDVSGDVWSLIAKTALSCGTTPNQPADDATINVYFHQVTINNQPTWCPFDVENPCPDVFEGRNVTWQSQRNVGTEDDPDWQDFDTRFRVWFHPLEGTPHPAPKGSVTKPVQEDAPKGVYKYTVWDWPQQGNQQPVCEPLDPNFNVF